MYFSATRPGINLLCMNIQLKIDGKAFNHFSNVDVNLRLNSVASTFDFGGFFDENTQTRPVFEPLTFKDCEVWIVDEENDINEKILTGTILNHAFTAERKKTLSRVSGYSITGVLEDTQIPLDLYPLQFNGLGLDKITQKICDYFGLKLFIYDNAKADVKKAFKQSNPKGTERIREYLAGLARQRNITLAHDNLGRVVLYKVEAKIQPKIKINENDFNVISIQPQFRGQGVHSEVTVLRQADPDGTAESVFTLKNPLYSSNKKRPAVTMLTDGDNVDAQTAANAFISAEAKNFPIMIMLRGWTFNNKIVRAGFYIELSAPSIFVNTVKLVLESVRFTNDNKTGPTQELTAVLPSVYTGIPDKTNPFK